MGIKPVDPFLYFGIFAGFLPLLADFPYKYYLLQLIRLIADAIFPSPRLNMLMSMESSAA